MSLASRAGQARAQCKGDIQRRANEGALLVHEVNELRVQKRSLQTQVRSLQQRLEASEQSLKALEGTTAVPTAIEDRPQPPPDGSPHAAGAPPRTPSGSLP